uniref:Uncharacterized protein n=1 Tax=Rhizophora mucronata TaxID=61149 RepID=A0A2P2NJQ0_RHIMU
MLMLFSPFISNLLRNHRIDAVLQMYWNYALFQKKKKTKKTRK